MQHIQPTRWKFKNFEDVAHLCYYNPTRDTLSQKVIDFKDGVASAVGLWSAWALGEITKAGWGDFDFVIRSLSSGELVALPNAKPLDKLGNTLASGLSATYNPQILEKSGTTRPMHTIPTAVERRAELAGKYVLSGGCPNLDGKKILVIDDVTTAGTTLDTVAQIIKSQYPNAILYGFCLAQTNRDISNDSINHPFTPPPNKTPLSEMFS